jgi:hypothetical protein
MNIVGDVEFQYRVNADGSLNLRLFNRENDILYGQGLYSRSWNELWSRFWYFAELVNKIFKKYKLKADNARPVPRFKSCTINFSNSKKA